MSVTTAINTEPWVPSVIVKEGGLKKKHLVWGWDDDYPSRVKEFVSQSPTASGAVDTTSKFLVGRGFSDPILEDVRLNRSGHAPLDLLRMVAVDMAMYGGFAIHVNYNMNGQITSARRMDLRFIRLAPPDDHGFCGKVYYHRDWDRKSKKARVSNVLPDEINLFNPDYVESQIRDAGGIQNYRGQVLFVRPGEEFYPLSLANSVLPDIISERKMGELMARHLRTGFLVKTVIAFPAEPESQEKKNQINNRINEFTGVDGREILILYGSTPERPITVQPLTDNFSDTAFVNMENTLRERIARAFKVPAVLLSIFRAGSLGASTEIANSFALFNTITQADRDELTASFRAIGDNWFEPVLRNRSWEIDPLEFVDGEGEAEAQPQPQPEPVLP